MHGHFEDLKSKLTIQLLIAFQELFLSTQL